MPRERLSMRKIREVLRLQCGLTQRQVAQSCKVGLRTTDSLRDLSQFSQRR